MSSLSIKRISNKFREIYDVATILSGAEDKDNSFETKALAATSLVIKCGIDETQAATSITDGYHDMGIDAIYLDEAQKTLFLVQSKWRNDGKGSINQEEMNTFVSGIKRILSFELDGANDKIMAKQLEIEKALDGIGYKIEAVFIHTGSNSVNDYIMRPMNELMESTNDEAGDILHFSQISLKDVYEHLASHGVAEDITIDDVVLSNWGKVDEPFMLYYGITSASAVGEWYSNYGNKLFAQNIRFYKGRTDVNEGIKKVLTREPQNFLYYNNGIKLLCKRIKRKVKFCTTTETGIFTLEGVSLINGAQTTGSIGSIFVDDPSQLENAKVMIQLIDMSMMPDEIARSITKLTNTQNRIENKDFAAQDPTQERIKGDLSFSHIQYLYKTGEEITDMTKQISFDEAIVALACLYQDPAYTNMAKRNVGSLSEDITKAPYKVLFNTGTNSYKLLNAVLVIREVEKKLKIKKSEATGKTRAACVHGNRIIEHLILQVIKKDRSFSENVISITAINEQIDSLLEKIVSIITRELETTFSDSYPLNVVKNQAKSRIIIDAVKTELESSELE